MNAVIEKRGTSLGIKLPKVVLDELGFTEHDKVEITTGKDCIVLRRASKPQHITVKERLEKFYGKSINKIDFAEVLQEIETGKAKGEEVWIIHFLFF